MKSKIALLILIGILFQFLLQSCSKIDNEFVGPEKKSAILGETALSKISSLSTFENKKIAYSMLSNGERLNLWTVKLKNDINSGMYNTNQINAIIELSEHLDIEIFKGGDAKEIFKSIWLPKWIEGNKAILSNVQIYNIAFSLPNSEIIKKSNLRSTGSEGGENPNFCHCAINATWTCFMSGGYGNPTFGNCSKVGTCIDAVKGCGALADDDCDGNHCSL